jgi:hypothetical protein
MAEFDAETLTKWTTAALVLNIARYAAMTETGKLRGNDAKIAHKNAEMCGAELNARIPPRVMP